MLLLPYSNTEQLGPCLKYTLKFCSPEGYAITLLMHYFLHINFEFISQLQPDLREQKHLRY